MTHPRRSSPLTVGLAAFVALGAGGCDTSRVAAPYDFAVASDLAGTDGARPDLALPDAGPQPDLVTPPAPDLSMADMSMADLAYRDLAVVDLLKPPDLATVADLSIVRDLTVPRDLTVIPDLTVVNDLALPPDDLAGLDLWMPEPDLAGQDLTVIIIPDLAVPDLTTPDIANPPPDLADTDGVVPAALTFLALRAGDGAAALSSAATPVFIDRFRLDGTPVPGNGFPVAMPTTVVGAQRRLTISGTATSEGSLTRSGDGRYVLLGGYDADVGTAAIAATTVIGTNRVVGRIGEDPMSPGHPLVDTSTALTNAFNGRNIRGAVSDGTNVWAFGSDTSSGIYFTPFGTAGAAVGVTTSPSNTRICNVAAGQLYCSSNSTPFFSIYTVGVGEPTMAGNASATLPGLPAATGPSPYGFALLDRDPMVPGVDTLYIADDGTATKAIYKYTFNGMTWALAATFNNGFVNGARGLCAVATGNTVTIIAALADPGANKIISIVDDGTMNPAATVLVTAATNTIYRGVAISPF